MVRVITDLHLTRGKEAVLELLAILGRGVRRYIDLSRKNYGPFGDVGSYTPTPDFELCDHDSGHLATPDYCEGDYDFAVCQDSERWLVGGGHLNMQAGAILIARHNPKIVVCAYGGRSKYLADVDGPSESEVMSEMLTAKPDLLGATEVVVWPRTKPSPEGKPAHTGTELANILELARDRGLSSIGIVTVAVHVPRTATYLAMYASREPKFSDVNATVFSSEDVLLATDYPLHIDRITSMRQSRAFAHTWAREAAGIQKILRDVYGDAKPPIVPTK